MTSLLIALVCANSWGGHNKPPWSPHCTKGNGFHGNASSVLAIAFFKQLHHGTATMLLWGMEGSQAPGVCTKLLNGPSPKCITGSDEDTKTIL